MYFLTRKLLQIPSKSPIRIIDDDAPVPVPWSTTTTTTNEPDPVVNDEIVSVEDAPVVVGRNFFF